jgi:hypothetical protein
MCHVVYEGQLISQEVHSNAKLEAGCGSVPSASLTKKSSNYASRVIIQNDVTGHKIISQVPAANKEG